MSKLIPVLLMLITTFIWGSAFVAQKWGMDSLGPLGFTLSRSLLGSVFLGFVLLIRNWIKEIAPSTPTKKRATVLGGFVCGCCLFLASTLQQIGLCHTTPSVSGFLTTLYILAVPILQMFLGQKPRLYIWIGSLFAIVALFLICSTGSAGTDFRLQFGRGEILTILCALVFAFQILSIDHFAPRSDVLALNVIQLLTGAVIGAILCFGGYFLSKMFGLSSYPVFSALENEVTLLASPDNLKNALGAVLYCGILSSGIAYTLQSYAQCRCPAALAAILMSFESVFALTCGWLFCHDRMTRLQLLGCLLLFVVIVFTQVLDTRRNTPAPTTAT